MPFVVSRAPTVEEQFERILSLPWVGPCPSDEPGAPCINDWVYTVARACAKRPWGIRAAVMEQLIDLTRRAMKRPEKGDEVRRAFQKAYGQVHNPSYKATPRVEVEPYNPDLLAEVAGRVPFEVTDDWLAEVSPECVLDVTPGDFLDALFLPGETVWCGKHDADHGDLYRIGDKESAANMIECFKNSQKGAKYLINPVSGQEINRSIRSEPNLTGLRHLLIESDKAPRELWLAMVVQMRAPILALYDSGKRSTHAVIRLTATNKAEFLEQANYYRRQLIPLGADKNAGNKPVQLSRLPGVVRHEAGKLQKLLYFAPNGDGQPIYQEKTLRTATNDSQGKP
jgi:hypothetical protein